MPLIVLDTGLTPAQVESAVSSAARSVVDGLPRGTLRIDLTPKGEEQLVVPLRLFAVERERQLARRLTKALTTLFRVLSDPPRLETRVGTAVAQFEQHGFTAADFSAGLTALLRGKSYADALIQADAASAVLAGITRGMPPSRLAMAVLTFAIDTPAIAHDVGPEGHLFDAYARVVLHVEFDPADRHVGLARSAIRIAFRNPLEKARHVEKSATERMRLAYERQLYQDENKLFAEIVAPTVIKMALVILSALPVGWLGRIGAMLFQAVVGFFQFLDTFFAVTEDGTVSEAEASELKWAAIGILPFLPIQLFVAGHAVIGVGAALLDHIVDGVKQLLAEMPMRCASADAGFDGFCVTDPDCAFFIPDGFEA